MHRFPYRRFVVAIVVPNRDPLQTHSPTQNAPQPTLSSVVVRGARAGLLRSTPVVRDVSRRRSPGVVVASVTATLRLVVDACRHVSQRQ